MNVAVYTLEKTLFSGFAEKVIARTSTGEITVLGDHIPLITTLKGPGVQIFDKSGKKNTIEFSSGILEVRPESDIVILANV